MPIKKYLKLFSRCISLFFISTLLLWPFCSNQKRNTTIEGQECEVISNTFSYIDDNDMAGVSICYPTLTTCPMDQGTLAKINNAIYDFAINEYDVKENCLGLTLDLTYELVSLNENYLSLFFTGIYYYEGSPYPSAIGKAITFSLITGETLSLNDFIAIDDLKERADAPDFNFEIAKGTNELLTDHSIQELISMYVDTNSNFYIRDDKIGIIVDLIHAEGDYAVIEFNFESSNL